uniref:C2 domain-containing protein n=2 Tax=Davidia involucrata TaxID=16924 RepID=A0A5B6ZFD4_DAVIN
MDITEASIIHHVGIVLFLLWLLSFFNCCHPVAYFISLIYLYLVHERCILKLRRKLQFEERRQAYQRRVLSDSETVRWLNHVVEKMWPVCMEQIVSQKILLPIIPWFLHKYKPWTAKEAVVEHLYLGRSPPMFTDMRVLRQSTDDDHLVLELGMNFRTADDMIAILGVKLRKRLGFGMWAKLHLMGMHVEGKVLIGVKFLRQWPFLGRLRVCFIEPPYFQMTVKPIFTHGLDVTELPGIAGWLDKLLALAFEQSLVEPNMLVVDVDKFASPQPENWFSVDEKEPIGHAIVEVVEAADVKPSDLNGLADPYVKGKLGPHKFRTNTQKKTLAPKWHEEFKIPICSWELPNVLTIEVCDKDHFVDDTLGDCSINISDLRDGQRHDMWLSLQNIKMGRLHLAITVVEGSGKFVQGEDQPCDVETLNNEYKRNSFASGTVQKSSFSSGLSEKSPKVADKFEPIFVEGQQETGIWVHHPGSEVSQTWEPRKGKGRLLDTQIRGEGSEPIGSFKSSASYQNDSSSSADESLEGNKGRPMNTVRRGLQKISSVFHRSPRTEDTSSSIVEPVKSPHVNIRALNTKETGVKLIVEDNLCSPSSVNVPKAEATESLEGRGSESPSKGNVKDMAKSFLKHAEKSARGIKHALSRKGLTKSQGDSVLAVTQKDSSAESESSDESPPSSVFTPRGEVPIVPNPISSCGNDSFKSMEHVQTTPSDPAMNIEDPVNKVSLVDLERVGDYTSSRSVGNGDGLVEESSNPKPSDENMVRDNREIFSTVKSY